MTLNEERNEESKMVGQPVPMLLPPQRCTCAPPHLTPQHLSQCSWRQRLHTRAPDPPPRQGKMWHPSSVGPG